MSDTILLVDGLNLLFRAFFGIPSRIPGSDGQTVHGVVGFVGALLKALNRFEPTHLAVVFDHEDGSFRDAMDENYKSNRTIDRDEDPHSQLEYLYRTLDHAGWKHCRAPGFEADDIIAAYARRFETEARIIILTTDSDMLQLVKPGVSVFAPKGQEPILYGPSQVEAKYGVAPKFIPDLKALTGDKTDNLAGVPGVGPKTASGLIQRFGCVTDIFDSLDAIKSEALRGKLIEHREKVIHNLSMIRLDQDAPLPFGLPELAITRESRQRRTMKLLQEAGVLAPFIPDR